MSKRKTLCISVVAALLTTTTGCGVFCALFGLGWDCAGTAVVTDQIVTGANVWNAWKSTEAGGSGTTLSDDDYQWARCKGCHGWDWRSGQGGYVRRAATTGHPAGNLANPLGTGVYTDAQVQGAGGRVPGTGANDQTHPDFTNLLTPEQIAAVVAFLNFADAQFIGNIANIDTTTDPATYTFPNGDATNGQALYVANCQGCHGAPDADSTATTDNLPGTGGFKAYLAKDGKYSELAHKARWGGGGTMTRAAAGNLTSAQLRDLCAYLKTVVEGSSGGDATAGAAYFTANGCSTCHCANGAGGCLLAAPDIRAKTAAEIFAQLNNAGHTGGVFAVTQADADNLAAWLATQ